MANAVVFAKELERIIERIEEIDKQTEWQPREPQWWLEMMQVDKQCRTSLRDIKKRNPRIFEKD